jgi:hypothetical protein
MTAVENQPATPAELAAELIDDLPKMKRQFDRMVQGAAKALAEQNPDDVLARVFHGMLAAADRESVAATAAMAVLALAKQRADELDAAPRRYELPAEPPPEVTELWDDAGWHLTRSGDVWVSAVPVRESLRWRAAVYLATGPLSTTPPTTTEGATTDDH